MNWTTLKAEIRFKFKFQFTENLAKFTTGTVFALYQHQGSRSKMPLNSGAEVCKPKSIKCVMVQ